VHEERTVVEANAVEKEGDAADRSAFFPALLKVTVDMCCLFLETPKGGVQAANAMCSIPTPDARCSDPTPLPTDSRVETADTIRLTLQGLQLRCCSPIQDAVPVPVGTLSKAGY